MALPALLVISFATLALGQRPFFAGLRPIGYPEVTTEALADRFGEVGGTTQRLPLEANGDRDLVDRLSKLPIDKQPFWLINWQALEAHRQKPQSYPQKPNPFLEPSPNNGASNSANLNSSNTNFNSENRNSNHGNVNASLGNVSSNIGNVSSILGIVNSNLGNASSNLGNAKPNLGNVNPNLGHVHSISGSAASNVSEFVNSNRFGVEEHPNNQNPIEHAYTNSNPGSANPYSSEKNDKKKPPMKLDKNQHSYRPY